MSDVLPRPVKPDWKPPRGPNGEKTEPVPCLCTACGGDLSPFSLGALIPDSVLSLPAGPKQVVLAPISPTQRMLILKPLVCPYCKTAMYYQAVQLVHVPGPGVLVS